MPQRMGGRHSHSLEELLTRRERPPRRIEVLANDGLQDGMLGLAGLIRRVRIGHPLASRMPPTGANARRLRQ